MKGIRAGVLPTVIVVSVILLLGVAGVFMLWESDFLFFARTQYHQTQRSYIASGLALYCAHPDVADTLQLFGDDPASGISIETQPWGLYDIISITPSDVRMRRSAIVGNRKPAHTLLYPDHDHSLTLSGYTNLHGRLMLPAQGFTYGQMNSRFFLGQELTSAQVLPAPHELPRPDPQALTRLDSLFTLRTDEDIYIDPAYSAEDTIIVCRKAVIGRGFQGSMQLLALDSIIVEPNVTLRYPSGLYSETFVELGERSEVNGYVIVDPAESTIENANYISARTSLVRGLVWVDGFAQLQGIVSGAAYIDQTAYYSPQGYYRGILHDFTLLENPVTAYPLWMASLKRTVAKWVD